MSNSESIEKIIQKKRQEISALEKQRQELWISEHKEEFDDMIGRAYIFKNAYSHSERWNLYVKIIGYNITRSYNMFEQEFEEFKKYVESLNQ